MCCFNRQYICHPDKITFLIENKEHGIGSPNLQTVHIATDFFNITID